jgi:hypothetical protein
VRLDEIELVTVQIEEHRNGAVVLAARRSDELHAERDEPCVIAREVIGVEEQRTRPPA